MKPGIICFFIYFASTSILSGQNDDVQSYINRYKDIAIQEMHRTGIPASIKLAQAILESNAGRSELAENSYNHFGIKCGPEWDGDSYFKKDDDFDRRGRLIKSCFRVFESPENSFQAHSEFLTHPGKQYRYGFLFTLDRHDYKSWAWGLKHSGYATNPRYANLLIDLIEKHALYSYDYVEEQKSWMASASTQPAKKKYDQASIRSRKIQTDWKSKTESIQIIKGKVTNNGLEMAYAQKDDTPLKMARRLQVKVKDILTFNERLTKRDQALVFAERVYFQKKKKSYKGSKKTHRVKRQETMYDIAQFYGIQLDKLYTRNRMYPGMQPAEGEQVYLRGSVRAKFRPKTRTMEAEVDEEQLVKYDEPASPVQDLAVQESSQHVVQQGETLYSIAKQYKISLDNLVRRNELDSNTIQPGQILWLDL